MYNASIHICKVYINQIMWPLCVDIACYSFGYWVLCWIVKILIDDLYCVTWQAIIPIWKIKGELLFVVKMILWWSICIVMTSTGDSRCQIRMGSLYFQQFKMCLLIWYYRLFSIFYFKVKEHRNNILKETLQIIINFIADILGRRCILSLGHC